MFRGGSDYLGTWQMVTLSEHFIYVLSLFYYRVWYDQALVNVRWRRLFGPSCIDLIAPGYPSFFSLSMSHYQPPISLLADYPGYFLPRMCNLSYVIVAYVHQARASRALVQPVREFSSIIAQQPYRQRQHDASEARGGTHGGTKGLEAIRLTRPTKHCARSVIMTGSFHQGGALGDTVT